MNSFNIENRFAKPRPLFTNQFMEMVTQVCVSFRYTKVVDAINYFSRTHSNRQTGRIDFNSDVVQDAASMLESTFGLWQLMKNSIELYQVAGRTQEAKLVKDALSTALPIIVKYKRERKRSPPRSRSRSRSPRRQQRRTQRRSASRSRSVSRSPVPPAKRVKRTETPVDDDDDDGATSTATSTATASATRGKAKNSQNRDSGEDDDDDHAAE